MSLFFNTAIARSANDPLMKTLQLALITLVIAATFTTPALIAQGRPNVTAQKTAMEKLKFLAGTWKGKATISSADGTQITLQQSEDVRFKLDGLLLLIEGTGRNDSGAVVFNALAIVSYDPHLNQYRIRAWNGGNFVETELKVLETGFEWGFQQGPVTMRNRMNLDAKGRWSEKSQAMLKDGKQVHGVQMLLSRD